MRASILAATFLTLWAMPAHAQYGGPRQIQPTDSAVWGELGFFAGGNDATIGGLTVARYDATVMRTLLRAYIGVGSLELAFAWGFAFGDFEFGPEDESAFRFGNPFAGLHFKVERRDFVLRIGGGFALPVATLDDDATGAEASAQLSTLFGASSIDGYWDLWLWHPDRFTIVAPSFRMDGRGNDFVWAAEAASGFMIHTGEGDADTEVPLQIAVEGGARLGRAFVMGGRFQTWFLLSGEDGEDAAQLAFVPFVRVEGENGFGYARLVINLDEPLGFAFDDDGIWGLHVGGGARF